MQMANLNGLKKIVEVLKGAPAICFFSGGKDSIVMADLFFEASINFIPVFLYFVKDLSYKKPIIEYYSIKWGRKIIQRPDFINMNMKTGTHKYKMNHCEKAIRNELGLSWLAFGYKKNDSLSRRGQLARLPYGIDERNKKIYPLAEWSDKEVLSYIKLHKLKLPIEYSLFEARHDLSVPDMNTLLIIKRNLRADYDKIIAEFPQLEAAVWGLEHA